MSADRPDPPRRWIGGSPCSGKSTVARHLADAWSWTSYGVDDHFEEHGSRRGPAAPTYDKISRLSTGERLAQSIDTQVSDVRALAEEHFDEVVTDVGHLPGPALVEGAALLPSLLARIGVTAREAIWLVPTEAFQRHHYARREWAQALVADLPDPGRAFEQWMRRDAAYARLVAEETERLGYRLLIIDGSQPTEEIAAIVAGHLRRR